MKLFATLRKGRDKVMWVEAQPPVTTQMLIDALEIPQDQVSILLVNGRDATPETVVTEEDYVSIFPPVGGG